jgi:hypothetical protein
MKKSELIVLNKWLLAALLAALVYFLPGVDLYSHLHFSWIYNYMMDNKVFLLYDFSTLGGQQFLYSIGVVAYVLSGALWFLAGKASVHLVELVGLVVLFLVSQKIFGKNLLTWGWLVLVFLFMLLPDTYPYFISAVLFYLGLCLIKVKKDRLGETAILLAGLNHPYVSVANLVFLFGKRTFLKIGVVLIFLVQLTVFGYKFFSGVGYGIIPTALLIWIIPSLLIRTSVLFFPLAIKLFFPSAIKKIRFRYVWGVLLIGTMFLYYVNYTTAVPIQYKINCYYNNKYADVGRLDGNVRIVDICRNGIYSLPEQGNVLTISPYFEGQQYYEYWETNQYLNYLKEKNASYVIHCRNCSWFTTELKPANELEILQQNFPLYKETDEYLIFKVK